MAWYSTAEGGEDAQASRIYSLKLGGLGEARPVFGSGAIDHWRRPHVAILTALPPIPMPTTFFDLPRELRDSIYRHVLVSETGFIEPNEIARLEKSPLLNPSTTTASHRFVLNVLHPHDRYNIEHAQSCITISLLRTNRQIYEETRDVFWLRNTFYFRSAITLGWTLKAMGQIPSRLIEAINLNDMHATTPRHMKSVAKAFRLLASRARHGNFKRLVLTLSQHRLETLVTSRDSIIPKLQQEYDDFLYVLREASDGCKYERRIEAELLASERPFRLAEGWEKSAI